MAAGAESAIAPQTGRTLASLADGGHPELATDAD
jgi:hypothetical protein